MTSTLNSTVTFVALCLLARLCYSLNDIFIGRLARTQDRTEVAAFRGASLGLTMAPWLLLVPATAWFQLRAHLPELLLTVSITAAANVLQFHAARYLPFGLRAALMLSTMALCSVLLGWGLLDERLTFSQIVFCTVLVVSGVGVAVGNYSVQEIRLDVPRGAFLIVLSALLMACAIFGVKHLAQNTHPLLTAWAWEFGSGLVLLGPALLRSRHSRTGETFRRFRKIAAAASPTAIASGTSVLALNFGELGLWGALGGTQILFTASLGALWHTERLGVRRWLLMCVSVAAVAGLALGV